MKNSILINQKAISEFNKNLSFDMQLNLEDVIILDWMMNFHGEPRSKKLLVNEVVYFWMSYGLIIKENPLLGITNKTVIEKHIDKLITVGLVDQLEISEGDIIYFTINQQAFDLIFNNIYEI